MNKYEQFQEAMRTIQARRTAANALAEARTREVNERFPQIREINSRLSDTAMELFHVLQAGGDTQEQIEQIRRRNLEGQRIVRQMLLANGLPEDYLELHYTCPKCDDTGYANGSYCDCLKRELGRLAIEEMNRHAQVKLCSFDSFSLEYYRNDPACYETMRRILAFCKRYAAQFDSHAPSLLLSGNTGLGKTHLSLAIASEVMQKGYGVLYDSVINLLRRVEREHFGRGEAGADTLEILLTCDLLILDDLGAEFDSSFYVSTVYNIINTRLNCGLPTIISTNLTHEQVQRRYEDRIVSRLFATYTGLHFVGTDVRLQKAKKAAQQNV
ncbi:ATP-binding protein [Ruminococcus champanellensis]|uniref:ATP-binding protein n=1 Tax=Ruminococcus champanellensis TaxID=1161942 RepID=UPI00248CAF63|nr:ATP-binding protein [Ruminococcus champanellensis]